MHHAEIKLDRIGTNFTMTATIASQPAIRNWGRGLGLCSGQMEPVYDLLEPLESIPDIKGRTVWTREEMEADPGRWLRAFTADEVTHIKEAVRAFDAMGLSLAKVDRTTFFLPAPLAAVLAKVRDEVINGVGFAVLRGLPVESWTGRQSAIACLGLGAYIGPRLSQNGQGHMLGHIKDLAEGKEVNGEGRIYRTHKAQPFHTDESDIVGLLCVQQAIGGGENGEGSGGESQVVSAHNIFNTLRREHPEVLRQLCTAHWFYDRKGEESAGELPWMRTPGFYYHAGRLSMKWDSYYVGALQRFWEKDLLPRYSEAQLEAIRVMEEYCHRLCLEMTLQTGDFQLVANTHNLHARSGYHDPDDVDKRRWLLRLWLATPEAEGGWPLPFADSGYVKRGGVQVNETPESYPLDAE
ncbi:taurine catabolism dioxygenase [Ophiostoma piceae UAMH 11346]|uniref:Taurine catabolism dioxygenase n=1 Tax=Ophiostoma piceae (strain UAMH 11346) TaxID=1262450 RepID=S3CYA3_OPHP1|nr:taurine catabolism dioxygenase [Ophiostoma piceae UAMH 11346]